MHTKNKYTYLKHLDFLAVDMLALLISFTTAFYIKFGGWWVVSGPEWSSEVWTRFAGLILFYDIVMTLLLNPYSGIFKRPYYMEFFGTVKLTVMNLIMLALTLYIFKLGEAYSRAVYIMMYCIYFVLSLGMKYIWKKIAMSEKTGIYSSRKVSLFVIADRKNIDQTLANVAAGDYDPYDIKGICLCADTAEDYNGIPVIGSDFADFVIKNNIDDVLIAVPPTVIGPEDYQKLIGNAVNVHLDVESMLGVQTEDQYIDDVGIYKTLSVGAFTFSPSQIFYLVIKRALDIVFGLIGLVLLIPITLIIKSAYLISGDKAKIFYTQKRVGLNGKPIKILKYRTMVPNAGEVLEELLKDEKYRREWEANQKLTDDPRITKVGRVLRKLSIDELPQMVNMLTGSMSLVGPRPLIEGELEAHGGLKLYQKVKPGITGWWGCNGRSNIEYRERLELEYYYIKNFSMYLDVLCVFRTVLAVLKKDGAE